MKTQSATIHLVQRTSRPKPDGTCPIVLSVQWQGRKERYTGISCTPNQWDTKEELLKKNCPNSAQLNIKLKGMKQAVIDYKLNLENNGKPYTAQMLFECLNENHTNPQSLLLADLIERKCTKEMLSDSTRNKFKTMLVNVRKYLDKKDVLLTELDEDFVRRFANWKKTKQPLRNGEFGCKDGTIRSEMKTIAAIWHFAISQDLVLPKYYPFGKSKFDFNNKYQEREEKHALNEYQIMILQNLYLSLCEELHIYEMVDKDSPNNIKGVFDMAKNNFCWFDDFQLGEGGLVIRNRKYLTELKQTPEKICQPLSCLGALNFCLLIYCFQGLAPADLCNMKCSQLKREQQANGKTFWVSSGVKRLKTGKPVEIRVPCNRLNDMLILPHLINKNENDWLIEANGGYNHANDMCKKLKKVWKFVNETHARIYSDCVLPFAKKDENKNLELGVDIAGKKVYWVDIPETTTPYIFRHTYASIYFNRGGNLLHLAKLMGRKEQDIFNYVHELQGREQRAEENARIMNPIINLGSVFEDDWE